MSLNMRNHVSGDLKSISINRFTKSGAYVDGYWVEDIVLSGTFDANIQPLNSREIKDLGIGLERIGDLETIGVFAQGAVQQYMTDLQSPPNAESTIKKKGSSNPLIDTGELRSSIKWVVSKQTVTEGL